MSLSPFDSFQLRFVTYLQNRPRTNIHTKIHTHPTVYKCEIKTAGYGKIHQYTI